MDNVRIQEKQFALKNRTERVQRLYNADCIVLSYPKSGRTWLRYFLATYGSAVSGVEHSMQMCGSEAFNQNRKASGLPLIHFTHDYFDYFQDIPQIEPSLLDREVYCEKPTILLIRDPRDVVVSYFYHKAHREKIFSGDIDSFVRSSNYGIRSQVKFVLEMLDTLSKLPNVLVLSYEDMLTKPELFSKTLSFCGFAPDELAVESALNAASFSQMQEMEIKQTLDNPLVSSQWGGSFEGLKVRRGKAGSYLSEIPQQLLLEVNKDTETKRLIDRLGA